MDRFTQKLSELEGVGRRRALSLPCGVDLTSNDYLGMAGHPDLRTAAIDALENGLDVGAAGSRLLRGHTQAHEDLENFAASYFHAPRSLYFSTGFQANYALLTALPARGDVIIYDALVHASMRDGIKASDAKAFKFVHNDLSMLEARLKAFRDQAKTLWVAIESVYSMDGDQAPIAQIYDLCRCYDAYLIVDEAHASGIFGTRGRGLCDEIIRTDGYDRLITLHTCGKAIGVAGGLVCASATVIDTLINTARPFIYSTAPIPLQAVCVKKSLEILDSPDGDQRRRKLAEICTFAQEKLGGIGSHILPIILGADEKAVRIAKTLQSKGFDVRAVRPPTVPEGTARLRISLSSALEKPVLQNLANALDSIEV